MSSQQSNTQQSPAQQLQSSLPYPDPGLSYWHRTTRAFTYLNLNKAKPVPVSAEYVVIGSGITGALTAFKLLEASIDPDKVLILEAREAVSGSSGRNAGHVRPDAFRGFSAYASYHGVEQALKIVENENAVLRITREFVDEHDVPCEMSSKSTLDVCFTREIAEDEARNVKEYLAAGGSMDQIMFYEGDQAVDKTGFPDAVAAYEWPAASIHPAKLAQWLLSNVIDRGAKLWTHCPATSITRGKGAVWDVHTPRGVISSQKVVHCTNAYAGVLVPQLSANFLTPIRVQVHSFVPTAALSGEHALQSTMSLRYGLQRFYALAQMESDGMIIFGVARPSGITFDESSFSKEIATEAVQQFGTLFPDSQERDSKHGEGFDHAWTGLIATTPDKVPYVGEIDGSPGQYICGGFNGHGMANIFTCAPGVVKLILGGVWSDTNLPECFRYSHERLVRGGMKG